MGRCWVMGLVWQFAGMAAAQQQQETSVQKPNVLFILLDDAGYADVGYQNPSPGWQGVSPNLDRFAYQGIRLTNHYSEIQCTPSRSALMTGLYSINTGMSMGTLMPALPYGLPLDHQLMPEYFKELGYATHHVGKWNLGVYTPSHLPTARGFDSSFGYMSAFEDYYTHQLDDTEPHDLMEANTTHYWAARHYSGQYSSHLFTDLAIEKIAKAAPDQPWFMYLSYQAVHSPLAQSGNDDLFEDIMLADRRLLAKVMHAADQQIAKLFSYLDETGVMENTVIVVTSDNGGCRLEGQNNAPYRGLKESWFEGGTKSFAFVYSPLLPEHLKGTEYSTLVHISDWLPTLALGVAQGSSNTTMQSRAGRQLDGVNHWPAITGHVEEEPRTEMLYWLCGYNLRYSEDEGTDIAVRSHRLQGAYRVGKWKLLLNAPCAGWFNLDTEYGANALPATYEVCSDSDYQKVCDTTGTDFMGDYLFNLETDSIERYNTIDDHPDIRAELMLKMHEIFSHTPLPAYRGPSVIEDSDRQDVWKEEGYWILPWRNLHAASLQYAKTTVE